MKKLVAILMVLGFIFSLNATTIYDIQYTTNAGPDGYYPSPMADQEVTVQGIVSGAHFKGDKFFMCDLPENGTGAWHGIYVYNTDPNQSPQEGDKIEVTGTVTEYYGVTELGYVTVTILSSGHAVPGPFQVQTINLVIPNVAEQWEGCLVAITNVEVTDAQNDYGEWYVDDGSGESQMDDGFFYLDNIDPPIVISVGQTWGTLIGCVDFSYDQYDVNPRYPADMIADSSDHEDVIISATQLMGNYPNPFNPETNIQFYLDNAENVQLEIYNLKGEKVKVLVNEMKNAGEYNVTWNGKDANNKTVSSGMYFYKLRTGSYNGIKKMILMK
jgi:hypothetical protein